MSKKIISFIIDADIARASGLSEHPVSSGSRRLLDEVKNNGHKAVMCQLLRAEWKTHKSKYATTWLASMISRKQINFIKTNEEVKFFIEKNIEDGKDKEIALKDAHLLDAALHSDKIIASNDGLARNVFHAISARNGEIGTVIWFNPVFDMDFISSWMKDGVFIPEVYYLHSNLKSVTAS